METTKDRLKAYLAKEQIKHSEFCKRIGVSQAFVSSMRKGISPDKVELIRKEFPDLSLVWLLTGQGSMYNCKNDYNSVIDDACVNYSNSLQTACRSSTLSLPAVASSLALVKRSHRTILPPELFYLI